MVEIRDDPMKVWPPRVEIDSAKHALCKPSEIAIDMKEEVNAGGEQQDAPNDPLGGDQAEDAAETTLVASSSHWRPQSLKRVISVRSVRAYGANEGRDCGSWRVGRTGGRKTTTGRGE